MIYRSSTYKGFMITCSCICSLSYNSYIVSIPSTVPPCGNERVSKMFCMIKQLQNNPIKWMWTQFYTNQQALTGCPSRHRGKELSNMYTEKAKAASVGDSVTSTRDNKCQFSSCHHVTPLHGGWMGIHEWSLVGRLCRLWLKLAMSPPSRFCKDILRTCKHAWS